MAVQLLLDKGLKKEDLILETTSTPIIEMLKNGSIDIWAYSDIADIRQIQESGQNASDYEKVLTKYIPEKNGKEKALAAFNDPKGNFTRDRCCIFAYDYQGRTLALSYQPDLIGTNRIDVRNPNGVDFVQQCIDMDRRGNGFLYYVNPDSSRNMTPALKPSYVANVDGIWFLGSGIYAMG